MSYAIVKGLKVDENGNVFLKSSSNNVSPRTYDWWECKSLSKIFQEQGQKAFDIEILKQYEDGNFQPGTKNKYSRAVARLRRMPEYKSFDWHAPFGPEYDAVNKKRATIEFDKLLYKAFLAKDPPKKRCIIQNNQYSTPVYVKKVNRRTIPYTRDRALAKKFDYPHLAQRVIEIISAPKEHFSIEILQ